MGYFEPRQETPFVTIKGTLAGATVNAGDAVASDASGTWARADGTDTLMIGVAASDGVVGDTISIYVEGIFRTTNGAAGAVVVGDVLALEDHTTVDDQGVGDRSVIVVGPLASNAAAGTVDVAFTINSPLTA